MKTATDRPKTDYYWKCYAEAELAARMAALRGGDRRMEQKAKAWGAKARRAARMNAAA